MTDWLTWIAAGMLHYTAWVLWTCLFVTIMLVAVVADLLLLAFRRVFQGERNARIRALLTSFMIVALCLTTLIFGDAVGASSSLLQLCSFSTSLRSSLELAFGTLYVVKAEATLLLHLGSNFAHFLTWCSLHPFVTVQVGLIGIVLWLR